MQLTALLWAVGLLGSRIFHTNHGEDPGTEVPSGTQVVFEPDLEGRDNAD